MAQSEVKICNLALSLLGERKTISSLTDSDSETARVCNKHYEHTRDSLLEAFTFNFSMKGAELSLDAGSDPVGEFTNLFQLPTDCLRVIEIYNSRSRYEVKGRLLYANDGTVKIKYISKETNPTLFSALFTEALITKLAANMADDLSGSRERRAQLLIEFKQIWREAKTRDSQENRRGVTRSNGPSGIFKTSNFRYT